VARRFALKVLRRPRGVKCHTRRPKSRYSSNSTSPLSRTCSSPRPATSPRPLKTAGWNARHCSRSCGATALRRSRSATQRIDVPATALLNHGVLGEHGEKQKSNYRSRGAKAQRTAGYGRYRAEGQKPVSRRDAGAQRRTKNPNCGLNHGVHGEHRENRKAGFRRFAPTLNLERGTLNAAQPLTRRQHLRTTPRSPVIPGERSETRDPVGYKTSGCLIEACAGPDPGSGMTDANIVLRANRWRAERQKHYLAERAEGAENNRRQITDKE